MSLLLLGIVSTFLAKSPQLAFWGLYPQQTNSLLFLFILSVMIALFSFVITLQNEQKQLVCLP
jgi:hypothetical protein